MAPFSPLPLGWTPCSSKPLRPSEHYRPFPHIFGQTLPTRQLSNSELLCPPEGKKWMFGLAISCLLVVTWLAAHPITIRPHGAFDEVLTELDESWVPWSVYDPPEPMVGYGRKVLQQRLEPCSTIDSSISDPVLDQASTTLVEMPMDSSSPSATTKPSASLVGRGTQPTPSSASLATNNASISSSTSSNTNTTFTPPPQATAPTAQKVDEDDDDPENSRQDPPKQDRRRSRNRGTPRARQIEVVLPSA